MPSAPTNIKQLVARTVFCMTQDGQDPEAPMRALDEQVRSFTGTALEREGVVTGWVLLVASSRFDDDGTVLHAYDYSIGPDCPMVAAVGLVELGSRRMHRDIARADDDRGDEDLGG